MAEYWKSTPKYWCKHCSVYVRDTKLERQNHDATAKHQGAVKRALRDLHRGHEREEREKERAKREIDRLNGVVSSDGSGSTSTAIAGPSSRTRPWAGAGATSGGGPGGGGPLSGTERKRQAEQLASLGVSLPDEFRKDLAMAGDWQVTSTTIVTDTPADGSKPGTSARGVHKRERTDEEIEEEKAIKGLFKKPRRWGRDSRTGAGDGDSADLDALLCGGLVVNKQEEDTLKKEEESQPTAETAPIKQEEEEPSLMKKDPSEEGGVPALAEVATDSSSKTEAPALKTEDGASTFGSSGAQDAPAVTFKKRKPKNIRQK
ncbi:putative u1 zinc finger domain-containing protein [Diaporthe ampelina]|uniref:Putative u1 zinc finger domain-containing protein n=1 Tax=Diaporthe ampelina TaxID=1214573 RepID=A0A0G2HD41_9PEZI|nr:putative u1 zinc finger domain-containing protein [Diaporthe ampelina]